MATSMAGSVAGSVAGGVASTAGTSVTMAAAGGAAGAAGGAAGSAAGGALSGSATGSITAIVYGAQRYNVLASLAANMSEMQSGVADSMGWASGDFGWLSHVGGGELMRRMSEGAAEDGVTVESDSFTSLLNILLVLGIMQGCVVAFVICTQHVWRYRANRRYYRIKSNLRMAKHWDKLQFRPLPSVVVMPGLPMLAFSIFATGLAGKATTLLVLEDDDRCNVGCKWIAVGTLLSVGLFMWAAFVILIDFHTKYRQRTWTPMSSPADVEAISDPAYRLVAKARARYCRGGASERTLIDRPRGVFARPPDETAEPGRTERLLHRPLLLMHENASDSLDAVGFALMARSGGASLVEVLFEYIILAAQILIAALSGLSSRLEPGSVGAVAQLLIVLAIQATVAHTMLRRGPSNDRVMSLLVGTQFLLEAATTGYLVLQTLWPSVCPSAMAQPAAFVLALLSMLAPIIQRAYDAVVVQVFKLCRKESDFSIKGAVFAAVGCCVFLPSLLITLLDATEAVEAVGEGLPDARIVEAAADDVNKLATKQANQKAVMEVEARAEERVVQLLWQRAEERRTRTSTRNGERMGAEGAESARVEEKVVAAAKAFQRLHKRRRTAQKGEAETGTELASAAVLESTTDESTPFFEDGSPGQAASCRAWPRSPSAMLVRSPSYRASRKSTLTVARSESKEWCNVDDTAADVVTDCGQHDQTMCASVPEATPVDECHCGDKSESDASSAHRVSLDVSRVTARSSIHKPPPPKEA